MLKFLKRIIKNWCLSRRTITIGELYVSSSPKNVEIDGPDGNLKFIGKADTEYLVETPSGYSRIKNVLKTIEYDVWNLELNDNKTLQCADNHIVIDANGEEIYVRDLKMGYGITTIDGISTVKSINHLTTKENMYDLELLDDNHVYFTNGILSHNTLTIAVFLLWESIFFKDKTMLIASKNFGHAIEIMDRLKYAYEELPVWLKPGVIFYNRMSVKFDNSSMIASAGTTEKTGRGSSISRIYCDELAFINPRIQEAMWASLAPTLATGGSAIISSTPNGDSDLFANLWRGAMSGTNDFFPVESKWDEHPERSEDFKTGMIKKIGELKWRQEFENEFLSSDPLLISSTKLITIKATPPVMSDMGFNFWIEEPVPGKTYLVGVDVGTGTGSDFSTVQVFEFPSLFQVAEFRSNSCSIPHFYHKIKWLLKWFEKNDSRGKTAEVIWSFENNGVGHAIAALYNNDENPPNAELVGNDPKTVGTVTTGKNKILACLQLKSLVEKTKNNMQINSEHLLFELKNYMQKGGSYAAKAGATDDLVSGVLVIIQMIKRMADFDARAYQQTYGFDESEFNDENGGEDSEPVPFAIV